jgi:cell fate (sporulation/competence/biofilm development) regulator YlbF (YheA/YmcA/DUF963 family)
VYSDPLVRSNVAAAGRKHHIMTTLTEETVLARKTRELCEAIVAQPEFQACQQRIEAFMNDEIARAQYEAVVNRGQALQEKQQRSLPLEGAEIAEFEQQRDALLKNPVAKGFMEAQEQMHEMQHSLQKPINKTLELGRVPTAEDLEEGGCGKEGGCGCHH